METDVWLSLKLAKDDSDQTRKQDALSLLLAHDELTASEVIPRQSVDRIFEAILAEDVNILEVQTSQDEFFHSRRKKILFCLRRNTNGDLDDDLGITKRHFIDEELAKKWRDNLMVEFHPRSGEDDADEELKEISGLITKSYKRMIGKA
jgi:hypothetical protein